MNFSKYGSLYSAFHGCSTFGYEQGIIILQLLDEKFENWSTLYFDRYKYITSNPQQPLVKALKTFFKTEDPCTVFCMNDTWSLLMGNTKEISPVNKGGTFKLYATPYFVNDPGIVSNYLPGNTAIDSIFPYQNCIIYLDNHDVPKPGGCYFETSEDNDPLYRICILSSEPMEDVLNIAREWSVRRHVVTIPFRTKETIVTPKFINLQPIPQPYLADIKAISNGRIYKKWSEERPELLFIDILKSYHNQYVRANNGHDAPFFLDKIGLLVEYPIRLMFEGQKPVLTDDRTVIALSVNGTTPTRTILARYPYETYMEYNEVPAAPWTHIHFFPKILELSFQAEKVTIESVVLGVIYEKVFYCFSHPVLEGIPSPKSLNVHQLLATNNKPLPFDVTVIESYRFNEKFLLHRVQLPDCPVLAWCMVESRDTSNYAPIARLPELVEMWQNFFKLHYARKDTKPIAVRKVKIALTLAHHKVCFKTKLEERPKHQEIDLGEDDITVRLGQEETNFINTYRVVRPPQEEEEDGESSCVLS